MNYLSAERVLKIEHTLDLKGDSDMSTTRRDIQATAISGVMIPDSKLAREATQLVRDTESPLLFNHSTRVYQNGHKTDGIGTLR